MRQPLYIFNPYDHLPPGSPPPLILACLGEAPRPLAAETPWIVGWDDYTWDFLTQEDYEALLCEADDRAIAAALAAKVPQPG
jgi:hypothetical protein